jgi:hypothetical protein
MCGLSLWLSIYQVYTIWLRLILMISNIIAVVFSLLIMIGTDHSKIYYNIDMNRPDHPGLSLWLSRNLVCAIWSQLILMSSNVNTVIFSLLIIIRTDHSEFYYNIDYHLADLI